MKNNKGIVSFRLTESDLEKLKKCGEMYGIKYTELIRDIICERLKKQDI